MVSFAAVDDDIDWVRLCFAHGASATNDEFGDYASVLAAIAAKASVEMAAFWLEHEVAGGEKVKLDDTSDALGAAAEAGRCDIVEFLLDKGARINEVCRVYQDFGHYINRDERAEAPLHRAIRKDTLDVMELLVDRGANVNLQDAKGNTPSSLALERNYRLVEWLRDRGAEEYL